MFNRIKQYLPFLVPGKMGLVEWSSPSNIALVKYWGKRTGQIPENPSLSFSLNESKTITSIQYEVKKKKGLSWDFIFEGQRSPEFEPKLKSFFHAVLPYLPYLDYLDLKISSSNTFPHSTGIASSASAMSALALGLIEIGAEINEEKDDVAFLKKASFISRFGSGSASRSVYPAFSIWGKTGKVAGSSDQYAIAIQLTGDSFFKGLRDTILIVSKRKKQVSSSKGHELMKNNPYAPVRYETAEQHLYLLLEAIKNNDRAEFIRIVELEALTLHGLMLSSDPGFILMKSGTIEIIEKIRKFREENGVFLSFTLDAGPNVHLIYHEDDQDTVKEFIENQLVKFTEEGIVIWDRLGRGPQKTSFHHE